MQRVSRSTAVAAQPAPPTPGGPPGFFTGGNPSGGIPATIPGFEWFNGVQEELVGTILRAGLALDGADQAQLRQALDRLYGGGLRGAAANITLTADDAGLVLIDAAAAPRTVTLPAANAAGGRPIRITLARSDVSTNGVTIQRAGTDTIEAATTVALPQGIRLTLISDGTTNWRVLSEAAVGRSIANPGWMRLPGGLLLQWVRNLTAITDGSGQATVVWTYPLAFPTAVIGYAYVPTNEAVAMNTGRAVAGLPTLTQQPVYLGGFAASATAAISGVVIGH